MSVACGGMSDVPDAPPPGTPPRLPGEAGAEPGAADAGPAEAGDGQDPQEAADAGPAAGGLSARDVAVLAVEARGWPGPGAKERAVRERLGMSPTRYYQLLNALLDDPRALAHDPVTVNRLRRVRQSHRDAR
jgi:hypothetical protein